MLSVVDVLRGSPLRAWTCRLRAPQHACVLPSSYILPCPQFFHLMEYLQANIRRLPGYQTMIIGPGYS